MTYLIIYLIVLAALLIANHAAGTLNQKFDESFGEDYYGE